MCATMLKLRMRSGGIIPAESSEEPTPVPQPPAGGASPVPPAPPPAVSPSSEGGAAAVGPTAVMPLTVRYELKYVFWWMRVPSAS